MYHENGANKAHIKTHMYRRNLLPGWVQIFCWVFLFISFCVPVMIVLSLFGLQTEWRLFGLITTDIISAEGLSIIFLYLLKGFTAFQLLFSKNKGILWGKIDSIISLIVCIFMSLMNPILHNANFITSFRLEILILLVFLYKIFSIEARWKKLTPEYLMGKV